MQSGGLASLRSAVTAALPTLPEFATCFPLSTHLPVQRKAELMVSKDLGLAAPGRLTVWAETKGKAVKERKAPVLGGLVSEAVAPAVAVVVPLSSGCHPSLSLGPLGRRAEQMDGRRPLRRQYHCCQLFPKQSCSSLTSLFLPFLPSSCFTLFFSLFPVISQFLKFDTMLMLAKRSPVKVSSHV